MDKEDGLYIAVLIKRFVATGGAERYAVEVTRRLRDRGHRIDLYARKADRALTEGIEVIPVPDSLRFSSVLSSWAFARHTAKLLAAGKYDVVFSHERGYCQDLATIHTFSYRLGQANASFLKKLNGIYLSPRSWLHLRLERQQMESPWLVPVSSVIRGGIERYYGRSDRVVIATPGVDIDWFHPDWVKENRDGARRAEKIRPDDLAVLFVGSEFKRKGLDDLIRAIRPGMKLLVVGKGERSGHYLRLADNCGVTQQVSFKGLTDDVRHYYAAADVVALPSLKEAFGMSILEGMACGLPVISGAAAGVSSLISSGDNGLISHNQGELADLLESLKAPQVRRRLGEKARLTAEKHTWERTARQYESVCYKIAGRANSGSG